MATAKKTTKAEPTPVDASKLNVYQKLAIARKEVADSQIKKSGDNTYQNYQYVELKDFLPKAIEVFSRLNLIGLFKIDTEENGVEYATLTIINAEIPEQRIEFKSATAHAQVGKCSNPIQLLGAKHTFMRRYLWIEVLEITESDFVEADTSKLPQQFQQYAQAEPQQYIPAPQEPVQAPTPAPATQAPPTVDAIPITKEQFKILEDLTKDDQERKNNMFAYYKVNGFNELSVKQAVQAINQLEKKVEDK